MYPNDNGPADKYDKNIRLEDSRTLQGRELPGFEMYEAVKFY
jgi:hypothetical protein